MWPARTVVMTLLHSAVQVGVAAIRAADPEAAVAPPVGIAVVVAVAAAWAAVDGRRAPDAAPRAWFVAALVTGPAAGVLGLVGRALLVDATGVEALGAALVGGAAFTALLVLVPAMAGLGIGRLMAARQIAGRARPASQRNASA